MNILISEQTLNFIMMGVWLAVFLVAVLVEVSTAEVVSIWFCIGAIFALIFTFIPSVPLFVEIVVFLVTSIISLLLLRPVAQKWLKKGMPEKDLETIKDKIAVVNKKNDSDYLVKLNGVLWNANSKDNLEVGDKVIVKEINGNKLEVEKEN